MTDIKALIRDLLERQDLDGAIALLERETTPGSARFQGDLGVLYARKGAWEKAGAALLAAAPSLSRQEAAETVWRIVSEYWTSGRQVNLRDGSGMLGRFLRAVFDRTQPEGRDLESERAFLALATACGDEVMGREALANRAEGTPSYVLRAEGFRASKTNDLETWSRTTKAPVAVLEEPTEVASGGADWGNSPARYVSDGCSYTTVADAEFLCGWDFVIPASGDLLKDSGYMPVEALFWDHFRHVHLKSLRLVGHQWSDAVETVNADALFLSTPERMFIGHWILDFLPRLRILTQKPELKIALPAELPAKHRDLLALFGVRDEQLIPCVLGRRYRFRSLTVMRYRDACRPSPGTVRFVAGALRAPHARPAGKRLFLERGMSTRAIVNAPEVGRVLAELGFEGFSLAEASIAEQRETLAAAEIVVATYGSDLLAYNFMPPGSHLIELNYGPHDAGAGPTCGLLGLGYHLVRCREVASAHRRQKKDRDFAVDVEALRAAVRSIETGRAPPRTSETGRA